jgi:hypothetical protein
MIGFTVHYSPSSLPHGGTSKPLKTLIPYLRGSFGDKGFEI